jgi:hypothetical protein
MRFFLLWTRIWLLGSSLFFIWKIGNLNRNWNSNCFDLSLIFSWLFQYEKNVTFWNNMKKLILSLLGQKQLNKNSKIRNSCIFQFLFSIWSSQNKAINMLHTVLLLYVAISVVFCDTPANCSYEDIRGKWFFHEGPRGNDKGLDCSSCKKDWWSHRL